MKKIGIAHFIGPSLPQLKLLFSIFLLNSFFDPHSSWFGGLQARNMDPDNTRGMTANDSMRYPVQVSDITLPSSPRVERALLNSRMARARRARTSTSEWTSATSSSRTKDLITMPLPYWYPSMARRRGRGRAERPALRRRRGPVFDFFCCYSLATVFPFHLHRRVGPIHEGSRRVHHGIRDGCQEEQPGEYQLEGVHRPVQSEV